MSLLVYVILMFSQNENDSLSGLGVAGSSFVYILVTIGNDIQIIHFKFFSSVKKLLIKGVRSDNHTKRDPLILSLSPTSTKIWILKLVSRPELAVQRELELVAINSSNLINFR